MKTRKNYLNLLGRKKMKIREIPNYSHFYLKHFLFRGLEHLKVEIKGREKSGEGA